MTVRDLDRLAYAGAELPAGLGYADTLYFLTLRALYHFAKATDMDPEQGRREKGKLNEAVRAYRADEQLAEHQAAVMTATGAARVDYRKARSTMDSDAALAAADRIVAALDNIPVERGKPK